MADYCKSVILKRQNQKLSFVICELYKFYYQMILFFKRNGQVGREERVNDGAERTDVN